MSRRRSPKPDSPRRRMITLWGLLLAGAALLAIGAYAAWRTSASSPTRGGGASPRLKADRQEVDLGDVPLGQTVEVAFQLSNVGGSPLRFTELPYVEVVEGC